MPANADNSARRLRVSQLNPRSPTELDLAPDESQRAAIAQELGLIALPRLSMTGTISPAPHGAWEMSARMTARVVQPCVVTLDPVETSLSEDVRRVYSPHATSPEGDEVEMPDPDVEPLGQTIDPGAVMVEALALALPEYPRCKDADPAAVTGILDPEADPAKDADDDTRRPFAGLADLLAGKPRG